MKITATKKSLLITSVIILSLLLIGLIVRYLVLPNRVGPLSIKEYYSTCESIGCLSVENGSSKISDVDILDIQETGNASITVNFKIWDTETNISQEASFEVKKSLVENLDNINDYTWPRNFIIEIFTEDTVIPLPYWSKSTEEILLSSKKITKIVFTDVQADYVNKNGDPNYDSIKEDIASSLGIKDDLDESQRLSTTLFYYQDTLSKGSFVASDYEHASLFEIRGIADEKSKEDLKYNCKLLNKYFPEEDCTDPRLALQSPYTIEILQTEGFSEYEWKDLLTNAVIDDKQYVSNTRGNDNSWKEYYSKKDVLRTRALSNYMNSLLEYLYYNDLSCDDQQQKEICDEIYKLYNYSQYLMYKGEGVLCSRISFLPLLATVTKDDSIEEDLSYILENYPFVSECTLSGGGEGFCSVDLEERMSCIELLNNSLSYYEDESNLKGVLGVLVNDTLSVYLEENEERFGVWGREDINLFSSGSSTEELYPIKYYHFRDNYMLYNILDKQFDE